MTDDSPAWQDYGIAPQVTAWPEPSGPTPSQTVGPFYEIGMSWMGEEGARLVPEGTPGLVTLTGRILDGAGAGVPDAVVEIWQPDGQGRVGQREGFAGWGRSLVDEEGTYRVATVRPGPIGGRGAPYIAVNVFARGTLQRLATRVYLPDHPGNDTDPLLAGLPADRRATLIAQQGGGRSSDWSGDQLRHDIRLQGERETVFLAW